MKSEEKKRDVLCPPVGKPEQDSSLKKESSGDKQFDNAIDKMLKKPVYITPGK